MISRSNVASVCSSSPTDRNFGSGSPSVPDAGRAGFGGLDAPSSNELAHDGDGFFADMNERYVTWLKPEQNILLVVQAFSYPAEPFGRIPRADDVRMMVTRGAANVHALAGQRDNASIAYCCWGAYGSMLIGIADRPDLVIAARDLSRR